MMHEMVEHMDWSNRAMFDWLDGEPDPTGELRRLASHIVNVQRVWIRRAQGAEQDRETFRVRWPAELRAIAAENHREFRALLAGDAKRLLEFRMFDGTPARSSVETLFLHAFSHGSHHHGQMAAIASRAGRKFPSLAYLTFSRSR